MIEDGKVHKEAGYTTDLWTRKGIEFMEKNKERPFFLYPARNRHADYYRDKPFVSFPRDAMHPWQDANKQFHNKQAAMERLAVELQH